MPINGHMTKTPFGRAAAPVPQRIGVLLCIRSETIALTTAHHAIKQKAVQQRAILFRKIKGAVAAVTQISYC